MNITNVTNPNLSVSILFNREEGRPTLSNELCVNIFNYFSPRELSVLSLVSRHWLELATCNPVWRSILERIGSTVEALLTHPKNPGLFLFNSNDIFKFSLPKVNNDESLYQCMTRNRVKASGEDLTSSFESLVSTCELGIPKLRVYKSLTDSFTVALAILIGNPRKNEDTQAEISFISSLDAGWSNWDENTPPHFPSKEGVTMSIKNIWVSYYTWTWYAPSSFIFSDFIQSFHKDIHKMCAKRVEFLTPSNQA